MTICTRERACLFGDIVDGQMRLNATGLIAQAIWNQLPARFPGIETDAFIIMPNHIHGIVVLAPVGARFIAPSRAVPEIPAPPLGTIIRSFKAIVARLIRQNADPAFAWQRNYYERIIRTDSSMDRARAYILGNPAQWGQDKENVASEWARHSGDSGQIEPGRRSWAR